jgi:hypothetical protein
MLKERKYERQNLPRDRRYQWYWQSTAQALAQMAGCLIVGRNALKTAWLWKKLPPAVTKRGRTAG